MYLHVPSIDFGFAFYVINYADDFVAPTLFPDLNIFIVGRTSTRL